jgi:hypothetical protein
MTLAAEGLPLLPPQTHKDQQMRMLFDWRDWTGFALLLRTTGCIRAIRAPEEIQDSSALLSSRRTPLELEY